VSLGSFYGNAIEKEVFKALVSLSGLGLSTKMYVGDLHLNSLAMRTKEIEAGREETFDEQKYFEGFIGWLAPMTVRWARFPFERILWCIHRNVYVICLGSISPRIADSLDRSLKTLPYYLGALEVDESFPKHRALYLDSLLPLCRITETTVNIFREGFEGEDLDQVLMERLRQAGFTDIRYEVYNEIIFVD
jgi:hypothetical protein